jgi:hypothetical protein
MAAHSKSKRKSAPRRKSKTKASPRRSANRTSKKRWSARVMRESDALDLQPKVFSGNDPKRIAASLKRSAQRSRRRKAGAYQSAMSMLNFYINRAGRNVPASRKKVLERAKDELRHLYHRA